MGSIIAGVPPVLLALLTHDIRHAVAVACGYLVINGFLGNFMEPALLGRRFGLSTVVVVISVLFWGFVWGPVGMLLAVPLTMMVKVAMDNSYELRWLAVAMGQGKTVNHEQERRIISESAKAQKTEALVGEGASKTDGDSEELSESVAATPDRV